ncbi:hypothetical protein PULV_a2374 [Pseudoalteromonas ulvae UL12]|uniref:sigma-54-dependent transcriptional regulator n=1 Tax=Pseudoalteromonas ulvae TaxID=107327 RepID=UPI00186B65AE|nr:sigma-54 dependent transcriptional regulator [Pseudoalteromonas ulvae]MBE0364638.1 hypothetical protein [Pseudoalteromonas ulvae UL12]
MSQPQGLILIADDDCDIRFALSLLLNQAGYRTLEADSIKTCEIQIQRHQPDLLLLDMNFSRDTTSGQEGLSLLQRLDTSTLPIILMTAWGSIDLAVKGIKLGAKDFIEKPWHKSKLLTLIEHTIKPTAASSNSASIAATASNWIAQSPAMQHLETLIRQIAPSRANVLILGENGTGKSQLAARIHHMSSYQQGPFIATNMAAIPESLFESELFGHQKGAFTDAKSQRQGAFSSANGGSLFLDEIGALPLNLQAKLLQVLESHTFTPLGADTPQQVDVRLIVATNQVLEAAIQNGQFRQDLYYRLNTFIIELPPLRQRQADILPLAKHYLSQFALQYQLICPTLTPPARQSLLHYTWPGNIRELRHVMERCVLLKGHKTNQVIIDFNDLMLPKSPTSQPPLSLQTAALPEPSLEERECQQIRVALQQYQGNMNKAAQSLGISRHALYRRLEKYQLDANQFKSTAHS